MIMARKSSQTQQHDFTCNKCGSHMPMYNSETDQLECATCAFKKGMTDAFVEDVMKVLIEKHDRGEKIGYTYKNRRFKITFEELSPSVKT